MNIDYATARDVKFAVPVEDPRLAVLLKRINAVSANIGGAAAGFEDFADRLFGPTPRGGAVQSLKEVRSGGLLNDLSDAVDRIEAIGARLNELAESMQRVA